MNDYCTNVDLILIRDDDTLINENDLFNLISNDFKPMRRVLGYFLLYDSGSSYRNPPDPLD